MRMRTFLLLTAAVLALAWAMPTGSGASFRLRSTRIAFVSDAPMERIEASVNSASGLIDAAQRTFAVRIPVRDFQGFNSPLQREHFMENYMEVARFPYATFSGKIIEATDLRTNGTVQVRAKGTFAVHGVEVERIIPCTLQVSTEGVRITADFPVLLADHGIRIPKVVQQKLAPEVQVAVDLLFAPTNE